MTAAAAAAAEAKKVAEKAAQVALAGKLGERRALAKPTAPVTTPEENAARSKFYKDIVDSAEASYQLSEESMTTVSDTELTQIINDQEDYIMDCSRAATVSVTTTTSTKT